MKRLLNAVVAVLLALAVTALVVPSAGANQWYPGQMQNGYWGWCLQGSWTDVQTYPCNSNYDVQDWWHIPSGVATARLYNIGADGCLNGDTSRMYLNYPCANGAGWSLLYITGSGSAFLVQSKYNPNYCMAAPWWNGGKPIMVTPCNAGYSDQRWYFGDFG